MKGGASSSKVYGARKSLCLGEAREAGPACFFLIPCPGTGVKGAVQINTLDVAKRSCRGGHAGPCTFSPEARNLSHSGLLIAKHRQSNSTQDKTKRAARRRIWDPLV